MHQCARRIEKGPNMCGMSEIRRTGVRRVEYGWWPVEPGRGASNRAGGASKVAGVRPGGPGNIKSGQSTSRWGQEGHGQGQWRLVDVRAWLGGQETSMEGWAGSGMHGARRTGPGDVDPGRGACRQGEACPKGAGRAMGHSLTTRARRRGGQCLCTGLWRDWVSAAR